MSFARDIVFEQSENAILVMNSDLEIKDFNASAKKIFGGLKDKNEKYFMGDLIRTPEELCRKIKDEETFTYTVEKDGQKKHYNVFSSKIHSEADKVVGFTVDFADITEIVMSEERAKIQARRQSLIADISSNYITGNPESIKTVTQDILKKTGMFFNAKRSYVCSFSQDNSKAQVEYIWVENNGCDMPEVFSDKPVGSVEKIYYKLESEGFVDMQGEICENCIFVGEGEDVQKSIVALPLYNKDKVTGFFGMEFLEENRAWDKQEKDFLKTVANIISDFISRHETQTELDSERKFLKTTLMSVADGVVSVDREGRIRIINGIASELAGYWYYDSYDKSFDTVFELYLKKGGERIPSEKFFDEKFIESLPYFIYLNSKRGEMIPIEHSISVLKTHDGQIDGFVAVLRDCTEKKKRDDEIRFLSYHDQLTGLFNRRYFEVKLDQMNEKEYMPVTVAMADVNGLKMVNDVFGHNFGDYILKQVAHIMRENIRDKDILSRVGGDEFVILMPNTDKREADGIIDKIKKEITSIHSDKVYMSVSFGIQTRENMFETTSEVYRKAENLMYRNKIYESRHMKRKTIDIMTDTIFEKLSSERGHTDRVCEICKLMADNMGLGEDVKNRLVTGAFLHDIGKIAIDISIMENPGKLSDKDRTEVQRHPELGYYILNSTIDLAPAAEVVLYHHENWDGSGYPKGIKETHIPVEARILRIADSFDAITGKRKYKDIMGIDRAVEELEKYKGIYYDPYLVEKFKEVLPEIEKTI